MTSSKSTPATFTATTPRRGRRKKRRNVPQRTACLDSSLQIRGGNSALSGREFEARQSPDAKFAAALDRLMPLMHNYHTNGRAWLEHGVRRAQVTERNSPIGEGSAKLWEIARGTDRRCGREGVSPAVTDREP